MKLRVVLASKDARTHAIVDIPLEVATPDIVVWNRNVYVRAAENLPVPGTNGPTYVQAFAWWATTEGG